MNCYFMIFESKTDEYEVVPCVRECKRDGLCSRTFYREIKIKHKNEYYLSFRFNISWFLEKHFNQGMQIKARRQKWNGLSTKNVKSNIAKMEL